MRPICHILVLLFVSLSVLAANIHPINAAGEVVILGNHSSYIASSGALHVVGEVENTGDTNVNEIVIKVTYFNKNDMAIGSGSVSALQDILYPGMKAPFVHILTGTSVNQVDYYELQVSFSETDETLNQTLLVQSYGYLWNATQSYHIVCQVKNNGTVISTATNAIVTCYDSSEKVVAAKQSALSNLNPGQTGTFLIIIDEPQSTKIANYTASAISNEAIIIPEFSYTLTVLLIGCLLVFAISRKKKFLDHPIIRTQ